MFEQLLLNFKTKIYLENYLKSNMEISLSLILSGAQGLGKYTCAFELARSLLGYEGNLEVEKHPDFHLFKPNNGLIGKEITDQIANIANICASVARRRVIIIDDANTMSVSAANSLLKLIEDGNSYAVLIFVAHGELLATIQSRCCEIPFYSVNREDLEASYKEININAWLACDGRVGLYFSLIEDIEYLEHLEEFRRKFEIMQHGRELLEICHAIKEKDELYFFDIFTKLQLEGFLIFSKQIFLKLLFEEKYEFYESSLIIIILKRLEEAIHLLKRKGRFTRNDFFELLRLMVVERRK